MNLKAKILKLLFEHYPNTLLPNKHDINLFLNEYINFKVDIFSVVLFDNKVYIKLFYKDKFDKVVNIIMDEWLLLDICQCECHTNDNTMNHIQKCCDKSCAKYINEKGEINLIKYYE
jgi:hypothetical protein